MADFRRQPEWQQQADRHTQLIDPVLTVRPMARFEYAARRPAVAIDHALVFVTAKGAYDTYLPPHRPSRSDAAGRRYTAVYEVDMGTHPVTLDLELPSDDDAFAFGVTAELTWRVADPARFVASGERDVPTRLSREFQHLTRPVSRGFAIENSSMAEQAVQRAVDSGAFATGIGLDITCVVRLRLDDAAIAHRKQLREIRYAGELLDPQHELEMRRQYQQHQLEVLRVQQQQELNAAKINFYQYHLQQGGVAAWALHLAQHPEDSRLVMESMRADQLALIKSQLGVATELLKGEGVEDYQKEEPRRLALQVVNDILNQRLPGVSEPSAYGPPPGDEGSALPPPAPPAPPAVPPMPPVPPAPAGQPVESAPAAPAEPYDGEERPS
ncbi:PE-PGRS family protein [Streptomyces luomodiensis]|uniref:PE-PGRS family protein n=1 Tax=Streptomyces luomodiensis TaxID=3026192 RepID=A0ABY9V0Q7_9ACTN|nr:PE-PGRS family protein [Streptomyces sp. SCA4-21]WNE98156.1 PE-PGRS family protein [Streptomyces sp. SCA4-21]